LTDSGAGRIAGWLAHRVEVFPRRAVEGATTDHGCGPSVLSLTVGPVVPGCVEKYAESEIGLGDTPGGR